MPHRHVLTSPQAIFSVEGKLMETKEFESRATPGKKTGVLAIIEGVRFWAREDAINEDRNIIDPAVCVLVSRIQMCADHLADPSPHVPPRWDNIRTSH